MNEPDVANPSQTEFARFLRTETFGGIVLAVAAIIALIWANSPWSEAYLDLRAVEFGPEALHLHLSLEVWIRDGALALFFFVVGLELKRELVVGELANVRAAMLPVIAAAGGVALPALIAVGLMWGEPGAGQAWAIPMATDIAFALGVLALVGAALPEGVRTLLLGLAVIDDLFVIIVIAVVFSSGVDAVALGGVVALAGAWWLLQWRRVAGWWWYVPIAAGMWWCMHESGVHATIAGVLLGLLTRVRADEGEREAPAVRWEHFWQPWTALVVVPLFALAVAGVPLGRDELESLATDRIAIGVMAGLVIGKLVGITGAAWIAERAGLVQRPEGVTWRMVAVVGALGGIGFTVSILVAELALAGASTDVAKTAVLLASTVAGLIAVVATRLAMRRVSK